MRGRGHMAGNRSVRAGGTSEAGGAGGGVGRTPTDGKVDAPGDGYPVVVERHGAIVATDTDIGKRHGGGTGHRLTGGRRVG